MFSPSEVVTLNTDAKLSELFSILPAVSLIKLVTDSELSVGFIKVVTGL